MTARRRLGGGAVSRPPVTVQYFKYSGERHWRHQMVMLGEDGHGVWLGAPIGAIIQ